MVGDKVGRACVILNGICFGIMAAVDIHPNKVIGENALENAYVIRDDRLSPALRSGIAKFTLDIDI